VQQREKTKHRNDRMKNKTKRSYVELGLPACSVDLFWISTTTRKHILRLNSCSVLKIVRVIGKEMAQRVLSTDEIARHATLNDCWVILHGKVYDVTKFVGDHPGGPMLIVENAGGLICV
jgi:cytochrome b involved in lipid metabolism